MADNSWLLHARGLLKLTPAPGVDPAELAMAFSESTPRRLEPGEVLCAEGTDGDALFILISGTMSVQGVEPGTGRARELVRVGAPSLAGHMALIDGSRRSATCVAVDGMMVGVLTRSTVRRLLDERSARGRAFRRLLITTLAMQLTGANRRIAHLAAPTEDPSGSPEDQDASDTAEVLRIAGMLQGWTGDLAELEAVEWVPQVHRKGGAGPPRR